MRAQRERPAVVLGNTVFVVALMSLAAVWAWPIYQHPHFIVMAAVTIAAGASIALAGVIWRLHPSVVVMISVLFYLVAGVALAVPSGAAFGVLPTLGGLTSLVVATVTSWRQLITITLLPVGDYQALLVPAFIVLLAGTVTALSISLRAKRAWPIGVLAAVLTTLFGPVFGATRGSDAMQLFGAMVIQPREVLLGVLVFLTTVAWLVWRAVAERRARLAEFRRQSGVALTTPPSAILRQVLTGSAMIVAALLIGGMALAPMAGSNRDALRSVVDPPIDATQWPNPLSGFRNFYSNETYDASFFEFTGLPRESRVRLAVLDQYDGQAFVAASAQSSDGKYVRIPTAQKPELAGDSVTIGVTVEPGYQGVWLPTVGQLETVKFESADVDLQQAFFYNFTIEGAIDIAPRELDGTSVSGLVAGDSYTYSGVVAPVPDAGAATGPRGVTTFYDAESFVQLEKWVETGKERRAFADDKTLADVMAQAEWLTAHGYPSHGMSIADATWAGDLEAPRASKSGHSVSRIERLFQSMNEAGFTAVAGIGDDEQFATAVAMLAERSGFPARVVVGFSDLSGDVTVAGKDVRAWAEAQLADGEWVAIDATPQSTVVPDDTVQQVRDPVPPVNIDPVTTDEQPPTDSDPAQSEDNDGDAPEGGIDLGWLWSVLGGVGLVLLIATALSAPSVAIVLTKRNRRQRRQSASSPAAAIAGGWNEYVDNATDHGLDIDIGATRRETALAQGGARVSALAALADRAVFGDAPVTSSESEAYWRLVESELSEMNARVSRWDRLKSALSLRSLFRAVRQLQTMRQSRVRGE